MFGHWASKHSSDGFLPATVKPTKHSANSSERGKHDNGRQALKFNMTSLSVTRSDAPLDDGITVDVSYGALLDDHEPYASIKKFELDFVAHDLLPHWQGILKPVPRSLVCYVYCPYSFGQHSSAKSAMLGSTVLSVFFRILVLL